MNIQASDSIDARNNWWGTASRSEIRLRIYDMEKWVGFAKLWR